MPEWINWARIGATGETGVIKIPAKPRPQLKDVANRKQAKETDLFSKW